MKHFRIILVLACILSVMLLFASCGGNTDTSTQTDSETNTETDTDKDTNQDANQNTNQNTRWESQASEETIEKVEKLLESKHRLEYNIDGSFRVMVLADVHMNADLDATAVNTVAERIKMLVDEIKPNLIIMTGDNTIGSSSEVKLRKNINAIVSYIEEKKIPWCHVYGNHDHEAALPNQEQQAIYESYEYCISKDIEELSGTGTYVHGVYNKDGSLGSLIWLLDSGAYDTVNGGYDYIKQDQIDWYKQTSLLIKEYNNGNTVKGMMAFHIPLIENREADSKKGDYSIVSDYEGTVNEAMCPSNTDTNLLETIFELGDVKLIVTGHDHKNDYMFNYKGVKLSSSPNISNLTYYDETYQGARIIDLNESTLDSVPTRIRYLIKRLDPIDFDNIRDGRVLESFDGGYEEPVISGLKYNPLAGNVTIEMGTSKGRNDTDGLKISRDNVGNYEFVIDINAVGKVGDNKYLILWMDLREVDFRKACVGLASADGYDNPFKTDDNDGNSPKYYYLADGTTEWVELSHGGDGCFGREDGGSIIGYKGYFAFPIEDMRQGAKRPTENTIVTGLYFYASLWWGDAYLNKPFYIDNFMLCKDYNEVNLP